MIGKYLPVFPVIQGEPEVSEQTPSVVAEQNVLRLDVAVHHPPVVQVVHRGRDRSDYFGRRPLFVKRAPRLTQSVVHIPPPRVLVDHHDVAVFGEGSVKRRDRPVFRRGVDFDLASHLRHRERVQFRTQVALQRDVHPT